ncbi:hypothetical protein [Rosistilla oblonga]|uniref:Rad50/SbcC-type AAA domain-containing protein n=1 Tax=Rosistilla oblonga TaxID=2527990 RepID=A0A518IRG2_9BACT|nr:hypothetical protein [Rosistilla oblonga]QDV55669.1 hypothetical protein Mal33_16480 [Rosistilla oblonga]
MKFRKFQIRIQTASGPYGASIEFADGLVVVWADNSMGKSTCVRSMLIALGMEAMLTFSRSDLPLPPAVKSRLDSDNGEQLVLESEVFLEIENAFGQRIVTQRTIKGQRDKNLITVHSGPVLTQPECAATSRDYYVNLQGSATRGHGFHHFLAEFLGWTLPAVQSFDGSERPLYLQCIFPYVVVEQTRGWSTLQPPVPTHFRIRDAQKRVVEFLLNLDAHRVALKRQELQLDKSRIESEWKAMVTQVSDMVETAAATVQSLPRKPVASWPPQVPPQMVVPSGETWIPLAHKLQSNKFNLAQLVEQEIPRVQEIASAAQSELDATERETRDKQTLLSRLLDILETEQEEVERVEHRLLTIAEDVQRHKDVKTLQGLGSRQGSELDTGHCPICHQAVQDSLLPLNSDQVVMSLDENIQFLTEQKRTFELVLQNSKRVAEARATQVRSLNVELSSLRVRVRSLRQTLVSDARLPSVAAIRNRMELENAIKRDEMYLAHFSKLIGSFAELSREWKRCLLDIEGLPREDTTEQDRLKIRTWTGLIREQLAQFGFRSFPPSQVNVSKDSYRPEHDGFDIQADVNQIDSASNASGAASQTSTQLQNSISASDLIRTIWAYLNGMLEMGRSGCTNHPGFLVFDEPRQQSTRDVSFVELLRRASTSHSFGQQVIFFTSENLERLKGHLSGLPHSLVAIEGRVIKQFPPQQPTESFEEPGTA